MKMIVPLLSVLALGACSTSSLLQSSEPKGTIYSLRPAEAIPVESAGMAAIVEIAKPTVPPGFETDRVALYMGDGRTLDYFSGAKWPDLLDAVIQDFTRRTATNTLPYVVTTTPSQALNADYRLQVKVNEFQAVYGDSAMTEPRLMANMEFTLISLPEERIIRNFTLSKSGTATSNKLETIAAGLEKMLQEIEAEAFTKLDSHLRK